ncbi:MAG TPA: GMC family oxidoreductase [Chthonomonadaceae bacterium]|nr:GMC family oxidoreductase [Chthonomonadaceae bacterium]
MSDDRRVIVIGSGPSGAMAAHQLVRKGIPVTMLESGRDFQGGFLVRLMGRNLYRRVPPMESGTRHVASGDPKTDWYVNLAPGGVSNQWTGAVPRFAPEDFTEGERLHECYRWPVSYEQMVPYYEIVESLMDITADPRDVPNLPAGKAAFQHHLPPDWQRVARYAEARGQGMVATPLADGPPWLITRRGTAFNSFTNLVRPLLRSPHFRLIPGAHALRLEWSPARRRVEAVVYHDRQTGSQQRLAAGAVVVACGPLNSTKLLFDSACPDFPDGLGNTEGVLGRYLHDHPREWWVFDIEKPIALPAPSVYLTRLPYAASPPLLANSWTLGVVSIQDKIRSRFGLKGDSLGVQVFGTMIPSEQHSVRPAAETKDEFGQPVLDLCIRFEDDVIQNMIQARQHLLCLMDEAGYRATMREVVPQLFPGTSVHYGGTVRMHRSPQYGMLDAWNRLHAVPNVLVCDASCFTTGAEKNPTLTAMALAARAADRLADDLKTG